MRQSHVYNILLLILILLFSHTCICAQNSFAYKVELDTVLQSGFYNVALSPEIIAKCKSDLGDIRIEDNSGTEVAYILYTETPRLNEDAFTEFPVSYSDNRTSLIINNILPNSISQLLLLVKKSEAQRIATLSASDDAKNWFVIKENFVLKKEYAAGSDAFVQSVSFTPGSYKYFRITMQGKNVPLLNIVKAGVYRQSIAGSVYDSLPTPGIIQKDSSDKKSYVYLTFTNDYQIDRLSLFSSGTKYYKRPVIVYDKNTINGSLADDTLTSGSSTDIELHVKTNRLLLVIDNRDNVPLTIEKATLLQLHTSVTAYLETGKQYALYFGDSSAIIPLYDLQYFNDSIGSNIHSLTAKKIERISSLPDVKKKENNNARWVLWSAIIVVLFLLIYFSFKMIKDINNKSNSNADL